MLESFHQLGLKDLIGDYMKVYLARQSVVRLRPPGYTVRLELKDLTA